MSAHRLRPGLLLAGFIIAASVRCLGEDAAVDAQQIHEAHKLLPNYNQPGESLRQKLLNSGQKTLTLHSVADEGAPDESTLPPESTRFKADVCAAAAIVVGTPLSEKGFLSNNEAQVFTDYEVRLTEIIENTRANNLTVNGKFILTWPDGKTQIDVGTIISLDKQFPPLAIQSRYLFFLRAIPGETGGFQDVGIYTFDKDVMQPLGFEGKPSGERRAGFLRSSNADTVKAIIREDLKYCK